MSVDKIQIYKLLITIYRFPRTLYICNFYYINVEVYVKMFRKSDGAIDMVSLITRFNIILTCGVFDRCYCSRNHDGRTCSSRQYGTLNASNYSLSAQHLSDKRSDEHRNCISNDKVVSLHWCITSLRSVCSFLQRCLSSVSLPVSLVRSKSPSIVAC